MSMKGNAMNTRAGNGFSLIELLAVTAIVGIVAGMIGVAAFNARQKAYRAIARTEVQQIAQAIKSYWIAKGEWPEGFDPGTAGITVKLSTEVIDRAGLRGGSDNVYLQIPDNRLEDGFFLDPWGHPYQVEIDAIGDLSDVQEEEEQTYQITVSFMNSDSYYYVDDGRYDDEK